MAKKITVKIECSDCEGTGLYTGFNCHDAATTECRKCHGTGEAEISYIPFTGKKEKKGVKRVFPYSPWRNLFPDVHTFDDGTVIDFSEYGCTYDDWKRGVKPKPLPPVGSPVD